MRTTSILFLALLFTEFCFASEWVQPKDEGAVSTQVELLPQVREFMAIYPQAKLERIGQPDDLRFTPENEKEVKETLYAWFTTGLYGRYVLTMAVPFKLTGDRIHLATVGKPVFGIQEIQCITITPLPNLPSGQTHIQYSTFSASFGYEKLETLKEHGGDLDAIGITLEKHASINNFERAWKPLE